MDSVNSEASGSEVTELELPAADPACPASHELVPLSEHQLAERMLNYTAMVEAIKTCDALDELREIDAKVVALQTYYRVSSSRDNGDRSAAAG